MFVLTFLVFTMLVVRGQFVELFLRLLSGPEPDQRFSRQSWPSGHRHRPGHGLESHAGRPRPIGEAGQLQRCCCRPELVLCSG